MKNVVKKIIIFILVTILVLCAVSCGSGDRVVGVGRDIDTDIKVILIMNKDKIKDVLFIDDAEPNKKSEHKEIYDIVKKQMVDKNSVKLDAITGATHTIDTISYAAKKALFASGYDLSKYGLEDSYDRSNMKDGTYEAFCNAMNGNIKVSVEIDNRRIKNVKVVEENETPGIGSPLKDMKGNVLTYGGESPITLIPKEIVKHQSINVDAVSGATVTSDSIKKAVKYALIESGADERDFSDIVVSDTTVKDVSTDVLVVGAGGAGLASAISASQNGANVLIVEKNGEVGGDTLVCGAIYNSVDRDLQQRVVTTEALEKEVDKAVKEEPINEDHKNLMEKVWFQINEARKRKDFSLFDTYEWFILQTWNGGDKIAKLPLVKTLCEGAYEGLVWLKVLGIKFNDKISQGAGALWQRTHTSEMNMGTGFISNYVSYIAMDPNIDLMLNTKCVKLVYENGKIIGAECENKYGEKFIVNCKAVILATGGFSANSDMLKMYNTSGKWPDLTYVKTTNRRTVSNGDGIVLATDIGGALVDMDQIQLLYLSETGNGHLTKYPARCVNAVDQVIFINKEGKRFVNEGGRRDDICLAINKQTDAEYYIIESGDGKDYVDIHNKNWRSADGFTFDYLRDNGYIVVADTLPELAQKLSIEFNVLKTTIDTFNESVRTGEDEYGRTLFSTELKKGPFIATKRMAAVHHTMGGVSIDTKAKVLDKNEEVINGLFACGEVTGGIHGANRLGGNAVADTVVFGRIAGESAAKYIIK